MANPNEEDSIAEPVVKAPKSSADTYTIEMDDQDESEEDMAGGLNQVGSEASSLQATLQSEHRDYQVMLLSPGSFMFTFGTTFSSQVKIQPELSHTHLSHRQH